METRITMDLCSDDEEIQCMELLEGNYQLFMNWPTSSSSVGSGAASDGLPRGPGVFPGTTERYSASSSSSVNANSNLPMTLYSTGESFGEDDDVEGAASVPSMQISSQLAGHRFWHTIKSRPLIKTAIVRY